MKKVIRREREKNPNMSLLKDISDLVLDEEMFLDGDDSKQSLLLFDNNKKNRRIIIIGRKSHVKILCESHIWLGDGTFKTTPTVGKQRFGQLYTIAGNFKRNLFTLLRILMQKKDTSAYVEIYLWMQSVARENNWVLNIKILMTDFEKAPHAAKRLVFGERVKSKGCQFHFGQAMMVELDGIGLRKKYFTDDDFKEDVRKLLSLVFVPEEFIEERFDEIANFLEHKGSEATKLLERKRSIVLNILMDWGDVVDPLDWRDS